SWSMTLTAFTMLYGKPASRSASHQRFTRGGCATWWSPTRTGIHSRSPNPLAIRPRFAFFETLVDDRRIRWQQNTIQVDDLAVHNQLNIDRAFPISIDLFCVGNRRFARRWSMDANTRVRSILEPEAWSPPEDD